MLPRHVALVAQNSTIEMSELSAVAAALQKQVTRDFAPLWGIEADVSVFANPADVPDDYSRVFVRDDIDHSSVGHHKDNLGQPFALVRYEDGWSLAASHEVLEMLADPSGQQLVGGPSPNTDQGRVLFLVEVCDPCEGAEFSYTVNDFPVSDFYTPRYFDPVAAPGVRYSFRNSIREPREVLRGGYLSWFDPESRTWWQRSWFEDEPHDDILPGLDIPDGNLRAAIDRRGAPARLTAMMASQAKKRGGRTYATGRTASALSARADDITAAVEKLLRSGGGQRNTSTPGKP